MTYGGKRPGAGRPAILLNEARLLEMDKQGIAHAVIAERFGVRPGVISRRLKKLKLLAV